MMLECSPGEPALTGLPFMHHDDQGHNALRHYPVFKGLNGLSTYAECADLDPCLHVPQFGGGVHAAGGHDGALWVELEAYLGTGYKDTGLNNFFNFFIVTLVTLNILSDSSR